jgi:deoxyribonuclease V
MGDRYGAVDVHYPETGGARAALVIASDRRFATIVNERVAWLDDVAAYEPGNFFVRELPCIRAVLAGAGDLGLLIVDGYVDLDPDGRPGLGAHLREEFTAPIIGVAKTAFHAATHAAEVRRGTAIRPLYITAAGMLIPEAAALVAGMAGEHRMPSALHRVDALARGRR